MNARIPRWLVLVLLLLAAGNALAGQLTVKSAWARATPPGVSVGVVYFQLENGSAKSDRLLKLTTTVAASAGVHRTEIVEGIAQMREVAVLHVAPRERIEFAPGGYHVMLMGLKKPLIAGQKFELELLFEVTGARKVAVVVRE